MDKNKNNRLILVTNDDGIDARGINELIKIAEQYGRVVVVAPEKGQSGMSHSVSLNVPIYLQKMESENNTVKYSCSGTPVDCVKIALHHVLNEKPDLILSGINHGSNASVSAIYSGTMGAAREGSLNSVPAIAFSLLDHSLDADFSASIVYAKKIIENVLENNKNKKICLNVNFPKIAINDIKGILICRQTKGNWIEEFDYRVNPNKKEYFWLTGKFSNFEPEAQDTDEWALENNYVAIVPTMVNLTNNEELDKLNKWKW